MTLPATVHASAALIGERGVLIRGASGAGKSSLLLGLLAADPGAAWLVADDRVILTEAHGRLVASAPAALAGLMEIRGIGLVRRPFVSPVRIDLAVDLVPGETAERMPDAQAESVAVEGVVLPLLRLPARLSDGPLRVRAALAVRLVVNS